MICGDLYEPDFASFETLHQDEDDLEVISDPECTAALMSDVWTDQLMY